MGLYIPEPATVTTKGSGLMSRPWVLFFQQLAAGVGTAPGVLSNPSLSTPAGIVDGDFWVEASGTSPTRTISLMVRDGGTTHAVAQLTY